MKLTKPLIGVAAAALATGIAVPTMAGSGNKYDAVADSRDCGSGDVVNFLGAIKLWPPNHKFVPEQVSAVDNDSSSQVSLTVTPVLTDAVGGDGGPQHDPDYVPDSSFTQTGTGSATVGFSVRAERSGKGDGRTYTINWSATFDNGSKTCTSDDDGQSPFVIEVPHDMRGGADFNKNS